MRVLSTTTTTSNRANCGAAVAYWHHGTPCKSRFDATVVAIDRLIAADVGIVEAGQVIGA
jgi:hypothetical protein